VIPVNPRFTALEAAMMGRRGEQWSLFYQFRLDERVPKDHLLRRIDKFVNTALADIHEQLEPYYSEIGRPSVDPDLMIRFRRIGVITGGAFEGDRLSGEVVSGGNDWQSVRTDSCTKLDVRLPLKTTDTALIVMTYQVLRHGPPAVMQALDRGENVDPASYYFRLSGLFETAAPKYDWLNRP
jgi:Protein of unknown function (DUF3237)